MKIKYDAVSHVGSVRTNNEDMALVFGAFLRDDAQRSMVPMKQRPRFSALVADGMGGYGGGEIASEMTLRSFDEFLTDLPVGLDADAVKVAVKDWFRSNNAAVMSRAATDTELARMGTTLTGIFTYGPYEFMLNTGDSRVYRRRYDVLRQISTDHSERERLGDPTVASNLIYNAIGIPEAFVDVTCLTEELPVIDGDTYVICSDGLCDMISDDEIDSILAAGGNARALVDAAIAAGGRDNCTVVLLNVSMPPEDEVSTPEPARVEEPEKEPEKKSTEETPEERIPEIDPASLRSDACGTGLPDADAPARPSPCPVNVPVEAAIGFTIDSDEGNEAPISDEIMPPPIPEAMKEQAANAAVPEVPAAPDDSVQARAKTAGSLIKEAFNVLFRKN